MTVNPGALHAASLSGALPNEDAVLQVRESRVEPSGMRALDLTPMGGIAIRLLPDRGLDLGQAWFNGIPLAWISDVGEVPPLEDLDGSAWRRGFGGGLMVTCGLRNVGAPSEGHGLHGTFGHLPARDVIVTRSLADEMITVNGLIVDADHDPALEVNRTISTRAGLGRVKVVDIVTNNGDIPEAAPILYHCNFGFPLWGDGARLELTDVDTVARDEASVDMVDDWDNPPPLRTGSERVLEHHIAKGHPGWARLSNRRVGIAVTLKWDSRVLPIINQWIDSNPGMAVLGVEPSNCRTRGRAYDREQGVLPILEPGETRTTGLTIEARRLD